MAWNFFEIIIMFVFIILYMLLRIMPQWINYADIYVTKTVLSLGLLFFFYRLPHIYLPMSPTLGPMLVRMKRMVKIVYILHIGTCLRLNMTRISFSWLFFVSVSLIMSPGFFTCWCVAGRFLKVLFERKFIKKEKKAMCGWNETWCLI